jgi:hypothetical protein
MLLPGFQLYLCITDYFVLATEALDRQILTLLVTCELYLFENAIIAA